jgi:putative hydrolase of the HAD superfamily
MKKIKLSDYKGIVFDLDDTLIDRKEAYNKVFSDLYNAQKLFQKKFTHDQAMCFFWSLSPNNHFDLKKGLIKIKNLFPEFTLSYEEFYEYYYENLVKIIKPYNGAKEFLEKLIERKINFGIVTNGGEYQYKKVKNTGLKDKYNFFIASEIFGSSKPNIEIYLETLRQLKLTDKDVENILFIGDNPYTDIIGAQRIGFKTAWIKMDDNEYPDDLSAPDYIIESFRELEI